MVIHHESNDRVMQRRGDDCGFTLVELLIIVAVVAILMSFAAPGFSGLTADIRQTREYNAFAADLRLARLEAIKRGSSVTICARASATACGTDWSVGWHTFVESDALTPGAIAAGDEHLRTHEVSSNGTLGIRAIAIVRPAASAQRAFISFDARGRADWTVGTWVLCDSRSASEALALVINGAGSSRLAVTTSTSTDTVVDALGVPVTCPT